MNFREFIRRYTVAEAEDLSRMLNPPPSFYEWVKQEQLRIGGKKCGREYLLE